jgi:glycosyltransferase involved in cell wall biosynthesis
MKILVIHNFYKTFYQKSPPRNLHLRGVSNNFGLGILDSFALGIPMVTTDCRIHSPEIAYLESGRNGIMTSDNVESYVDSVVLLLKDDQFRNKIASACIEDSHRYSLEKMVDNFCKGILKALNPFPKTSTYEV